MSWYFVKVYSFFLLLIASCFPIHSLGQGYARMTKNRPNINCDFETTCSWSWSRDNFTNVSAANRSEKLSHDLYKALPTDGSSQRDGHYLFVFDTSRRKHELTLTSPEIDPEYFDVNSNDYCTLLFSLNVYPKQSGNISVLIQEENRTKVIAHHLNNDNIGWKVRKINLGRPEEKFRIILEIGSSPYGPSFVAIDNIQLENCFPDLTDDECPNGRKFRCPKDSKCIPMTMVCDIRRDCSDAADEKKECSKVPAGSRCTFENGWCGWKNATDKPYTLKWKLNRGTANEHTGPSHDNTYANGTGTYAYVDMTNGSLGSSAVMESVPMNPPPPMHSDPQSPFYNSCYVTFFYHKFGPHSGSLGLYLKEERMDGSHSSKQLWWSYGNKGDNWLRQTVILPNITKRYTIQFEAKKAMGPRGDVAIDDISFSPACFGMGIPDEVLNEYNYDEYPKKNSESIHPSFSDKPVYRFTSCGAVGFLGPSVEECEKSYNNSPTQVEVLDTPNMIGFQKWIVPETGFYTVIAKGGRGGKGADALGESRSAMVRMVTKMNRGQEIYMLVGQEGQDACRKSSFDTPSCVNDYHFRTMANLKSSHLLDQNAKDGGGGGGGGTFIFILNKNQQPEPIVVAAGGGGLAHGPSHDTGRQHGNGLNSSLPNITAPSIGLNPAGAGGGWHPSNFTNNNNSTGMAFLQGGHGGKPCYYSSDNLKGSGGFGGGGGGCRAGGGGGGYTGGRAWSDSSVNGEGGWSMVLAKGLLKEVMPAAHYGSGSVVIIPAVIGCFCEDRCVALDEYRTVVKCICSHGSNLAQDGLTCVSLNLPTLDDLSMGVLAAFLILICVILFICILCIYAKYLQQKSKAHEKLVNGARLSLNSLPGSRGPGIRLTDNQIYEFCGETCTIRDLREIPRDKVQLVKPLGCGAFGDVYQGLLRKRDTDSVDLAVAVKILPALSSNQAEVDFLMEALIMSKFNHPNVVHFIGACFDTHPRYIILELLAGGDLKNFLRENRPKAGKPSGLTIKDLLQCAMDVAKGCLYLEQLRFIHRDIAARNCLLTSRGPGRVVKIADFGMSRDIYRSDYYKKEGKAMVPIKWMPPEAFLDGIFSTKTDVWSFGVLLWEVMSLGFVPYTGLRNRDVMMNVARGARLGAPSKNCPPPVFAIMSMCWNHDPEQRPSFSVIVERLGYCMQDPNVINSLLPVYTGPLPSEIDKTFRRSPNYEEDSIQTDYMIPRLPDSLFQWKDGNPDVSHKFTGEETSTFSLPLEGCMMISSCDNSDKNNGKLCNNKDTVSGTPPNKANQKRMMNDVNCSAIHGKNEVTPKRPFTVSGQYVKDTRILRSSLSVD